MNSIGLKGPLVQYAEACYKALDTLTHACAQCFALRLKMQGSWYHSSYSPNHQENCKRLDTPVLSISVAIKLSSLREKPSCYCPLEIILMDEYLIK